MPFSIYLETESFKVKQWYFKFQKGKRKPENAWDIGPFGGTTILLSIVIQGSCEKNFGDVTLISIV